MKKTCKYQQKSAFEEVSLVVTRVLTMCADWCPLIQKLYRSTEYPIVISFPNTHIKNTGQLSVHHRRSEKSALSEHYFVIV